MFYGMHNSIDCCIIIVIWCFRLFTVQLLFRFHFHKRLAVTFQIPDHPNEQQIFYWQRDILIFENNLNNVLRWFYWYKVFNLRAISIRAHSVCYVAITFYGVALRHSWIVKNIYRESIGQTIERYLCAQNCCSNSNTSSTTLCGSGCFHVLYGRAHLAGVQVHV